MIFRRSRPEQDAEAATAEETAGELEQAGPAAGRSDRAHGPWDSSELALEEGDTSRVDLGALLISGSQEVELRLQVDEATQAVVAVLLVDAEGALELRPFAAPRNGDIWDDVRTQIAAETARRGGTATPAEGPYGTELAVSMPVGGPEGGSVTQPSRVLGIPGPRWLLRATFLGRPALEPDPEGVLERALREVVVVRGGDPMPPGEPLPLVMPGNAQQISAPDV